jgi:hypothetical protein
MERLPLPTMQAVSGSLSIQLHGPQQQTVIAGHAGKNGIKDNK